MQKPFLGAPLPGPYIPREVCPSARKAGDTPIQLEPGWGLEFPNAFKLEFQHQSGRNSNTRAGGLPKHGSRSGQHPHLRHPDAREKQRGSQSAKFPRDEGIAPFVKHLRENCGDLEQGSRGHRPGSSAGRSLQPAPPSGLGPGRLSRRRSGAALRSQRACSAGRPSSRPAAAAVAAAEEVPALPTPR